MKGYTDSVGILRLLEAGNLAKLAMHGLVNAGKEGLPRAKIWLSLDNSDGQAEDLRAGLG